MVVGLSLSTKNPFAIREDKALSLLGEQPLRDCVRSLMLVNRWRILRRQAHQCGVRCDFFLNANISFSLLESRNWRCWGWFILILWNSACILLYDDLLQRTELFTTKIVWRIKNYSSVGESACCTNLAILAQFLEPMVNADVVAFICNLSTSQWDGRQIPRDRRIAWKLSGQLVWITQQRDRRLHLNKVEMKSLLLSIGLLWPTHINFGTCAPPKHISK